MSNLMSFEDFADSVKSSIKEYLPDDYANAEIAVGESRKINSHYHSMTISKEGQNVSPSVNLDQMYAEYQKTGEIGPVLKEIAEIARMEPDGIDVHIVPASFSSIRISAMRIYLPFETCLK